VEIVLGVSMAPSTVRMVLIEGENADGVTVDRDEFDIQAGAGSSADRVVAAILGTRESASEGGYALTSAGVTWSDQAEAAVLRDALIDHKVESVMLVSGFLAAAAALAQTVGDAVGYARTALLFVEHDTATTAVIDSADGSIVGMERLSLADDDTEAVAALTRMVSGMDRSEARPDGVFVVGSGAVDVTMIKPELESATSLPVSTPEHPDLALARGAALASAHAPLFASSTQALAWAQDPGTGEAKALAAGLGYAYLSGTDHDATRDDNALAYSAVPDEGDSDDVPIRASAPGAETPDVINDAELVDSRLLDFTTKQGRKPFLVTGSALAALFVVGVAALVIALAISIRPTAPERPDAGGNVIAPAHRASPPPPKAPTPPPPTAQPPAPAPPPKAPAPAPPPKAPAPAPPPPAAPPPAPPPPAVPPIIPQLKLPGLPGGPPGHGWGHDDDGDHDHGGWGPPGRGGWGHPGRGHGGGIPIPIPIPGVHIKLGF
jgi:hypothetical protein